MGSSLFPALQATGWPPWVVPPANYQQFDNIAYILLPAISASVFTDVLNFKVPTGQNGVIVNVANNFVGGGWGEGSGDVVWQILRDSGVVPGYDNITASLGSPANPVRVPGLRIQENQVIEFMVRNNAVLLAGQRIGARLIGWFYPKEDDNADIWTG